MGQIYGLEKVGGITALVMELVEGDDPSQRIAKGAMPLDEEHGPRMSGHSRRHP